MLSRAAGINNDHSNSINDGSSGNGGSNNSLELLKKGKGKLAHGDGRFDPKLLGVAVMASLPP